MAVEIRPRLSDPSPGDNGRSRRLGGVGALLALALAIAASQAWAAAGDLDHAFSGDGKRTIAFGSGNGTDQGSAVALQSDGKIVVAGYSDRGGSSAHDFAVIRLKPNGNLDKSFSGNGRVTFDFPDSTFDDEAYAVAIQPNGRIVVAGFSYRTATINDFAVARLTTHGNLDSSFSGDGRKTIAFHNGAASDGGNAVALQRDGKIVVVGYSTPSDVAPNPVLSLARLRSNGNLDHGFAGDGRKTIGFGNANAAGNAVAVQRNGRILVAGSSNHGAATGNDFAIARLKPSGGLDSSFSGDGLKTIAFSNGNLGDIARGIALQRDGKIVVGGQSDRGATNGADFAVARLKANGRRDPTFSSDGRRTLAFGNGSLNDIGKDVAIHDGKILLAGYSDQGVATRSDLAVVRLKASGKPDAGFGAAGRTTIDLGNSADDYGTALALQRNGRIVVAGQAGNVPVTGDDFAVVRLLDD